MTKRNKSIYDRHVDIVTNYDLTIISSTILLVVLIVVLFIAVGLLKVIIYAV